MPRNNNGIALQIWLAFRRPFLPYPQSQIQNSSSSFWFILMLPEGMLRGNLGKKCTPLKISRASRIVIWRHHTSKECGFPTRACFMIDVSSQDAWDDERSSNVLFFFSFRKSSTVCAYIHSTPASQSPLRVKKAGKEKCKSKASQSN